MWTTVLKNSRFHFIRISFLRKFVPPVFCNFTCSRPAVGSTFLALQLLEQDWSFFGLKINNLWFCLRKKRAFSVVNHLLFTTLWFIKYWFSERKESQYAR